MPRKTKAASASVAVEDAVRRIVSSEHLVSDKCPELSELEFGLIIASHAFGRWMIRCMSAAGIKDMTETEILVLHHVNHRGREKKLADVCFVLNIEDTHVVSYALKKLANLGLVSGERRGKEVFWSSTGDGKWVLYGYSVLIGLPDAWLFRRRRREPAHRRSGPSAAHLVRSLRPGRPRRLVDITHP
jgi:predicted MarR family transcription regulator